MKNVKNFEKFKNIGNNLGFDIDIGTSKPILILVLILRRQNPSLDFDIEF